MLAYGFNLFTAMGTAMARGTGQPGYELRYTLVVRGLNLLLGILLIQSAGLIGLLVATLVATVLGSLYFLFLWQRCLRASWQALWREVYARPLLASVVAAVPAYFVIHVTPYYSSGRVSQFLGLAISASLFIALYGFCLRRSNHWNAEDRRLWNELASTPWKAVLTRLVHG